MEATLLKIVTSPEVYPSPGRPIRNLVAKCYVAIYSRGETRTLYDNIQAFLKILGDSKAPNKDSSRMYAQYNCVMKYADHDVQCGDALYCRAHGVVWKSSKSF